MWNEVGRGETRRNEVERDGAGSGEVVRGGTTEDDAKLGGVGLLEMNEAKSNMELHTHRSLSTKSKFDVEESAGMLQYSP